MRVLESGSSITDLLHRYQRCACLVVQVHASWCKYMPRGSKHSTVMENSFLEPTYTTLGEATHGANPNKLLIEFTQTAFWHSLLRCLPQLSSRGAYHKWLLVVFTPTGFSRCLHQLVYYYRLRVVLIPAGFSRCLIHLTSRDAYYCGFLVVPSELASRGARFTVNFHSKLLNYPNMFPVQFIPADFLRKVFMELTPTYFLCCLPQWLLLQYVHFLVEHKSINYSNA